MYALSLPASITWRFAGCGEKSPPSALPGPQVCHDAPSLERERTGKLHVVLAVPELALKTAAMWACKSSATSSGGLVVRARLWEVSQALTRKTHLRTVYTRLRGPRLFHPAAFQTEGRFFHRQPRWQDRANRWCALFQLLCSLRRRVSDFEATPVCFILCLIPGNHRLTGCLDGQPDVRIERLLPS